VVILILYFPSIGTYRGGIADPVTVAAAGATPVLRYGRLSNKARGGLRGKGLRPGCVGWGAYRGKTPGL